MPDTDNTAVRENFERWARDNTPLKLDRDMASYLSGTTQFAWMAWIESAVQADTCTDGVPEDAK